VKNFYCHFALPCIFNFFVFRFIERFPIAHPIFKVLFGGSLFSGLRLKNFQIKIQLYFYPGLPAYFYF
jgi:hypothetical protein